MKKVFKNIFRFMQATLSLVRVIMIIGMVVVVAISAYLIHTAYQVTLNQYNESVTWESTNYGIPLAEIEPVLVSNVVDTDTVTAAESWNTLEDYVYSLDGQNIDRKKADKIMEQAVHWQKIYNLDSDAISRLSLYLQIEDAIPEAYSTLNTEKLAKLAASLRDMELEKKTKAGKQYMKRLGEVVKDFMTAKTTVMDTILSIGTLKKGIWTIPYTYERSDLADVLEQIQAMRKFPALGNTADVLSDIATALNYNKNAREYFAYQKFKDSMDTVTRSDYIAVSSIYTYEQALENGLKVKAKERDGFLIRNDSPVTGIYYGGEQLENNVYIRKGTSVIIWVDPIYEPEEQVFEESEPDTGMPDGSDDSYLPETEEPGTQDNQTPEEPPTREDAEVPEESNQEGMTQ